MTTIGLLFDTSLLASTPLLARLRDEMPPLQVPPLRDDVRAVARRAWEDRVRSEYVGVLIVRRFHGLLVELNAHMDLQEAALTMMLDEQRHARLCMLAARALGSEGEIAFELSELQQAPREGISLERQLWEMLLGTYAVGEAVALALLRHAIRALPPSGFRQILQRIARDEGLHGRIGLALVRLLRQAGEQGFVPWPGDDEVCSFVARHLDWMRTRDVVEPDEAALFEDDEAAAQLCAVGIPPSEAFKAAYLQAVDRLVPRTFARIGLPLERGDLGEQPSVG